jgi:hypothetical protein
MPEVLEIQVKPDYILVTYTGEFNVAAAERAIDGSLQAGSTHNLSKILIDCRRMTGRLSIMDRYQVAVSGQRMAGKLTRVALVRQEEGSPLDRFTETVARNRGVNLKLFSEIDEAVAWLMA